MVDTPKVIIAAKEEVYGTDVVPTPADNRILTRNFRAVPLAVDQLDRNLDLPSFGGSPTAATNARQTMSFETELGGSGTAGIAPAWMDLLEGCGMLAPVLVADTSAMQKFAPVGAALSSLTIHHSIGDQLRKALGSRGTFGLNFTAGAYPFANYDFTGMLPLVDPFTVATLASAGLARWKEAVEVNDDNSEFLLDGYAAVMQSLTIAVNAEVSISNLVGERAVVRGNHAATFTTVVRAPSVATKNYLQSLKTNAQLAMKMTHGTVAGGIVEVSSVGAQITGIEESEALGKLLWTINGRLNVTAGQDDLVIVAK